jgi:selenocysteine lyase/cysteine desulfurase
MEAQEKHTSLDEALENNGMNRRSFLKLASYTAASGAAALTIPKAVSTAIAAPRTRKDENWLEKRFWKKVQNLFTLDPKLVYMNIGTTGSMPRFVLSNYNYYNRVVARNPWDRGGYFPGTTDMRKQIAPGYGCDYKELWMSENTTNGLAQIFGGLPFEAGDVILTTNLEHGAGLSPMYRLRDRVGVELKYIELPLTPDSGDEYVEVFRKGILEVMAAKGVPPKLVFFTHTPYKNGATLPVKDICAMARDFGCITAIDGAHNNGMFNQNFDDMGCDFYSGSGHKWQFGPGRTGIAYIRNQGGDLPEFWVTEGRYRADSQLRSEDDDIAGLLQSHGNPNYPAYRALSDSCGLWDFINRQKIEDRVLDLSAYTKQLITETFGDKAVFFCPSARELSSGLTSWNPFDDVNSRDLVFEFRERLREEYGYVIRYSNFYATLEEMEAGGPQTYVNRISTHLFHDYNQIDGLVEAMFDLFMKMTNGGLVGLLKMRNRNVVDDDYDDYYC